jgi:hypothetical protein
MQNDRVMLMRSLRILINTKLREIKGLKADLDAGVMPSLAPRML